MSRGQPEELVRVECLQALQLEPGVYRALVLFINVVVLAGADRRKHAVRFQPLSPLLGCQLRQYRLENLDRLVLVTVFEVARTLKVRFDRFRRRLLRHRCVCCHFRFFLVDGNHLERAKFIND